MSDIPDRPSSWSSDQLQFEPTQMVRWFDPRQLAGTAIQVVVSGLFGSYSDKREIQVALAPDAAPDLKTYAGQDELWFDYVADLGDGFDSTYTMAYLLAQPALSIADSGKQKLELPRGQVLVMGGDQVYPTAKRREYENRMVGPYRAALPYTPSETSPHLYLIPGNHDWYDGLTNFTRFFCQHRYIGGWLTRQDRSYFAFRLPHGWWLWGLDIQFDAYIDDPQLKYFEMARDALKDGDRIILATGKPSWIKGAHNPSYENLRFVEKEMVPAHASIAVWLSGDLHHYCRYEDTNKRQRITSGGGGAYLFPTHHLEPNLVLDEVAGDVTYGLQAVYPPTRWSKRRRWLAPLILPLRNARLSYVLLLVYLLPALLLQIPTKQAIKGSGHVHFDSTFHLWREAASGRWLIYAGLMLFIPMLLFAAGRGLIRVVLAVLHAAAHLVLISALVALAAWALPSDWSTHSLPLAGSAALVAAVLGLGVLGLYLTIGDLVVGTRLERFADESFSAQSIRDFKNFLRLHIDQEGALTIYPVGVDRVFRKKQLQLVPAAGPSDSWLAPIAGHDGVAHLIEEPIVLGSRATSS